MNTYTIYKLNGRTEEVVAERFSVEDGALVFWINDQKRLAIAPGIWESVVLSEYGD